MFTIFFLVLNLLIIFNFDLIKNNIKIYDYPDLDRKFHKNPVFIGGGIIIFINYILLIISTAFSKDNQFFVNLDSNYNYSTWLVGPALIFLIGLYDDKKNLSGNIKFILLSITYLLVLKLDNTLIIQNLEFVSFPFNINLGIYSFLFSYLCLMIFSNALNMLDGINLQAGLYTLIIFLYILTKVGFSYDLGIIILSIITYLYLNYKQKTFLGDSGTYLLSYIISIIFIKSYNAERTFLCDEIFMMMILPGLELIRLFSIRVINGKNPLSPDRQHIHHLLQNKFKNLNFVHISLIVNFFYFVFCSIFLIYSNIIIIFIAILFYILTTNLILKN